jgi:hypothetical protein
MANSSFVVVSDKVRSECFGFDSMKRTKEVSERTGLNNLVKPSCDLKFDSVACRENDTLMVRKRARNELETSAEFRPIKGKHLTNRGRCRPVVNANGQQSHGMFTLSNVVVLKEPWVVGNRKASTPTQVNTKKAKATIVRIITLLPRIAGRNRA